MSQERTPEHSYSERDRLAEAWLVARHAREWYIGDASAEEWAAAYAAVDVDLVHEEDTRS